LGVRFRRYFVGLVPAVVLLGALAIVPVSRASETTLSVNAVNGTVSVTAVNRPLDEVLREVGTALHARVVIESVLAGELARARVDMSLTGVSPTLAFRRLLVGRQYVLMFGPRGVDEVRVYVDGATGYRELTPPDPLAKPRLTSMPLPDGGPADDPAEIARLRRTVLDDPDASARRAALVDLSGMRDTAPLIETLTRMLGRERDSKVLEALFAIAAQQQEHLPADTLRAFAASDRDGSARALAVDMLATLSGDDPATRTLLRSLAAGDASAAIRETAQTTLDNLAHPAPPAPTVGRDRRRAP